MASVLWPLVNNVIRRNKISNTYGRFKERTAGAHWGWDFYAPSGTPCYAIADGTVSMIYGNAHDTGNFGLVAILDFEFEGKTLYAAYCHLSAVVAVLGKDIKAGEQIGFTGNSGNASTMKGLDEHLHFELRESARPTRGQAGRITPLTVFKVCPLHAPIYEP